jgi:hypothetical protein
MTVPKRFDVLRFFSGLLKVLAWITLVISIVGAISTAILGGTLGQVLSGALGPSFPQSGWFTSLGAVAAALIVLLIGLIYFVIYYALGELIALLVAMEENTRLSAALLLKMHQDTQIDTRAAVATYPGGFTNEPAPYK